MGYVREESLKNDNKEARKLLKKFWQTYDFIWDNLDSMTLEEYKIKSKEMWSYRNDVTDVSGDIYLFTLSGLDNRVGDKWPKYNFLDDYNDE